MRVFSAAVVIIAIAISNLAFADSTSLRVDALGMITVRHSIRITVDASSTCWGAAVIKNASVSSIQANWVLSLDGSCSLPDMQAVNARQPQTVHLDGTITVVH